MMKTRNEIISFIEKYGEDDGVVKIYFLTEPYKQFNHYENGVYWELISLDYNYKCDELSARFMNQDDKVKWVSEYNDDNNGFNIVETTYKFISKMNEINSVPMVCPRSVDDFGIYYGDDKILRDAIVSVCEKQNIIAEDTHNCKINISAEKTIAELSMLYVDIDKEYDTLKKRYSLDITDRQRCVIKIIQDLLEKNNMGLMFDNQDGTICVYNKKDNDIIACDSDMMSGEYANWMSASDAVHHITPLADAVWLGSNNFCGIAWRKEM